MKDSSVVFDFPSLSSITLTSKNYPSFIKSAFWSTTDIASYNKHYFSPDEQKKKKHAIHCCIIPRFFKKKPIKLNYQTRLSHYGQLQQHQIGTGASATVLLTQPIKDKQGHLQIYAIKVFRKQKSDTNFMKKLISEFCISSALDHPNICKTVDLVLDEKNRYCTVMEYCSGGDLYSYIKEGHLDSQDEIHGFLKQLLEGLSYLHQLGVAHRDIKPENLLLVKKGPCTSLKITDFGEADVFRELWQETGRLSDGLCGSTPYIAPEIFLQSKQGYQASQADVWSAGIVYFCMRLNGVPFFSAQHTDTNYRLYRKHYATTSYPAFESFDSESKEMVYSMLNPDPEKRYTVQDLLALTLLTEVKPPKYSQ